MNPWLAARNILAVRLDNAGDVVMIGPALRAVKETSPSARLTLLGTTAGEAVAPLLPWVDDVVVWRPIWQDLGRPPLDPAREQALIALLAARRFDAALVFTSFSQTPHVPGYVCYLAGIPLRAGESKEFGGATLTDEFRGAPDALHQVERNLRLVERLGFVARDRRLALALPAEARAAVPSLLSGVGLDPERPFVLIHPGASARARRYPPERLGTVARGLAARGWPVLVTGVERERELVAAVVAHSPEARALVGAATMPEYAALVERAALVVCGNTLPMHLADALGTPVLVLFAGTDLESQWAPRSVPHALLRRSTPCHPCYRFDCPIGQPCLDIPPEEVVEAALGLLEGALTPQPPSPKVGRGGLTRTPVDRSYVPVGETAPCSAPEGFRRLGPGMHPRVRGEPGHAPALGPRNVLGELWECILPAPRRIAVFRALHLGDLLCATPALRALRRRFPDAEITLIGLPWARELVARLPDLDRLAVFPGWPGIVEAPEDPARTAAFLDAARSDPWDLALQLHGDGHASNGFVAALGARASLGFRRDDRDDRLTEGLPWEPDEHETRRWLRLVATLGAPPVEPRPIFPTSPDEERAAERLLAVGPAGFGPVVALHPGARDPARRWPADRFAALADALVVHHRARIVLTGGPDERPLTAAVATAMTAPALDLAGETDLGTLAALVARVDLLVGNDTGVAHLAAAAGTRSVVLFGPARPQRWAALDRGRHVAVDALARFPDTDPAQALAMLPVADVLAACRAQLTAADGDCPTAVPSPAPGLAEVP